jgi:endonuclease VIII-like 1
MPELAEVMIMSEYINNVTKGKIFKSVKKSKVTKVKTQIKLHKTLANGFSIKAESSGKGLTLILFTSRDELKISVAMGMTGNWAYVPSNEIPKHAHLMFNTTDGHTLCLVDVRRFAKWKVGEDVKRGPCPVKEHTSFRIKVMSAVVNPKPSKLFEKPICEVLMDQKYFNGIGNYLRAEILYRLNINPFMSAKEAITKYHSELLTLCKEIPEEAYVIGGGELKDWENPYNRGYGRGRINKRMKSDIPHNFRDWLQCYQKGLSIEDSKGRKFWFNKKYQKYSNIYLNN